MKNIEEEEQDLEMSHADDFRYVKERKPVR